MAANSHFAAALLKLRRPGLHWTAEFSDPLRFNAYGEERVNDMADDWLHAELRRAVADAGFPQPADVVGLFEWAELVAYALADEIVFTNELQQEFMTGYCRDRALAARVGEIGRAEHHPTLSRSWYDVVDADYELSGPGVVDIGYFGVFWPSRGLTEVTAALRALQLEDRARVRLHVFTDKHEALSHEIVREGLADVVRVRPYAPYLSFLNLTTRLDVLMVNDAVAPAEYGVNPWLPSKVSDYLGSGTPIWAIQQPGSMLSRLDTAYTTELGDTAGARRALEQMIADLAAPAAPPDPALAGS
jgi:hypothetical protein